MIWSYSCACGEGAVRSGIAQASNGRVGRCEAANGLPLPSAVYDAPLYKCSRGPALAKVGISWPQCHAISRLSRRNAGYPQQRGRCITMRFLQGQKPSLLIFINYYIKIIFLGKLFI